MFYEGQHDDYSGIGMDSSDAKVLAELLKAKSFGSMLEHNSTLTFLNLSDNQMKAEGAAALADGLKANSTVQQLHPFGNKIPEDTLRTIMNSNKNISNFGGAVKLDYSGIGMDSSDAKVLAELLKANITVQWLDASVNGLDQASKDGLTKAKPPQLVTLKL